MAGRGRPRSFDRTAALEKAMVVFWEHGFDGTSMADLTRAMEISSPSLYAAFGSKERLFSEAVEHYQQLYDGMSDAPTARAAITEILEHRASAYADPATPLGCLVVAGATFAENSACARDQLAALRRATEETFRRRIDRGIADGDVAPHVDAAAVAAFYHAVMQGVSVQARDGQPAERLLATVASAVAAWDTVAG